VRRLTGSLVDMHVTVAIPTRMRVASLPALLKAVAAQTKPPTMQIEVLVIDNDPAGSAAAVAESARRDGMQGLHYVIEPVPGVASVRNRALERARGDALAFVDDDEMPARDWILRLATAMHDHQADAVFGPVVPEFPTTTATWVQRMGLFDRRRHATGQRVGIRDMRTGNVMISLAWLRAQRPMLAFDHRLGLTGGEDSLFFAEALDRGLRAVWCDEAAVTEAIPASRANAGYLVRRYFQIGISSCTIASIRDGMVGVAKETAKGLLLVAIGVLAGVVLLLLDRRRAVGWFMKAVLGAGKVAYAVGVRYRLYAPVETAS
jgi:succinoglycan biosynthesis protein ExoM